MKKEEILELSRKENKQKDMYEIEVETNGCKIAALFMVVLAAIYYCYEIFASKGQNYALYSIIAIYCSVFYGYKGIKLKNKRSLYIFCSITWGLVTLLTIICYLRNM